MLDFAYHKPGSIADALAIQADAEDGLYLAGGQTIIPVLKQGLAMPTDLIDLADIDELVTIAEDGDTLSIGAMVSHAEVASSQRVAERIPALARLAAGIGDPHVRNRGTIGGSIANADPAADYPAALVALGATIATDRREIGAEEFFTGFFETALEEDELVSKIRFPIPQAAAYAKFPNPASRYAMAGVFVARGSAGTRVAVTGAGPSVFRVPDMESALESAFSPDRLEGITLDADDLNDDMHASSEYRAHLIGVLAKRAVAAAG